MSVIKLVEPYAVTQLRKDVRDSLMTAGELAIALQLYHAGDKDAVPCPECGDDLYNSPEAHCPTCFGTMFVGGVRYGMKVWAMFSEHESTEAITQRGLYEPDSREVQLEAFPLLSERDVIVRVESWNIDGSPEEVAGFYTLQAIKHSSVRTGPRYGQATWDIYGQKGMCSELPNNPKGGITTYPVKGVVFEQSVQLTPASATLPANAVVEPDVKVIYFPFVATPSGETPGGPTTGTGGFTFTQAIPASTWTIQHNLGYQPQVYIIVGGEEVEAEVEYPNDSVVVIVFGTPVAGTARLT